MLACTVGCGASLTGSGDGTEPAFDYRRRSRLRSFLDYRRRGRLYRRRRRRRCHRHDRRLPRGHTGSGSAGGGTGSRSNRFRSRRRFDFDRFWVRRSCRRRRRLHLGSFHRSGCAFRFRHRSSGRCTGRFRAAGGGGTTACCTVSGFAASSEELVKK